MFAVSIGSVQGLVDFQGSEEPAASATAEELGYTGIMRVEHQRDTDGDGDYETVDTYTDENLIVDQGLNFFECKVAGVSCPTADVDGDSSQETAGAGDLAVYIAISADSDNDNGELAQSDTALQSEITTGNLSRREGTVTDKGVGFYSTEFTFTASQDFTTEPGVDLTGLHWSGESTAGDLVAQNDFPGVTLLADDKLTVSWVEVSFNRP
jgi:hypothetical protein